MRVFSSKLKEGAVKGMICAKQSEKSVMAITFVIAEGQELDSAALENATSTLTKSQAATVKKRVDRLNETLRNKKETEPDSTDNKKRDVREIFPESNNPQKPAVSVGIFTS